MLRGRSIFALMARNCAERGFKYNASPTMGAVTTRTTVSHIRIRHEGRALFIHPLTTQGLREMSAKLVFKSGVQAEAKQREWHPPLRAIVRPVSNCVARWSLDASGDSPTSQAPHIR